MLSLRANKLQIFRPPLSRSLSPTATRHPQLSQHNRYNPNSIATLKLPTMPVTWDDASDKKMLLKIIHIAGLEKLNWTAIAESMGEEYTLQSVQ